MKIILNSQYKPKLLFKKKVFYCQIGNNGLATNFKKKEGDKCTPLGNWKLLKIFIKKDKKYFFKFNSCIKDMVKFFDKGIGWCDDDKSFYYNKLVNLNVKKEIKFSYEDFCRKDDVYDLVIVLDYNIKPTIKSKGSAIFIHCSFKDLRNTNGCVAIKKNNLKFLINNLQKLNSIYIR